MPSRDGQECPSYGSIIMRKRWIICCGLTMICLAGCSRQAPTGYDPDRAKLVLIKALDAWKAGQLPSLATQSPPIRFQDDDLAAGYELIDYRIVELSLQILPFKNINLELELRDPQGKTRRKFTVYQVGLEPIATVQRSDN